MLAFAKDITQNSPNHPEESKNSELKEYMGYQRPLNHERLIYHALDLAKTSLQNHMKEFEDNQEKLLSDYTYYFQRSFLMPNQLLVEICIQ